MTDLLAATGSFMTLLFFLCERVKKLLYAYKSFDSWWRAESTSMSVYAVRLVCDASHVTRRADQWADKWPCSPICLSGAHLGRGANGLQIHTQCLKSAGIQMYKGWKKKNVLLVSVSVSLSPSLLCLFSQICQCHLGLRVILYPHCLTDRRALALWESKSSAEINPVPSAPHCRSGQQQVTSSAV